MPDTRHIILVCDAKRGLFIRDLVENDKPSLKVEREFHNDLAARSQRLGTSPPGRTSNKSGPTSAVEPTDYHGQEKSRFIKALARDFIAYADLYSKAPVVMVAPPRALALLREATHTEFHGRPVIEINKDLTKHPMNEIELFLTDLFQFKKRLAGNE